jgi:hypothetical protein
LVIAPVVTWFDTRRFLATLYWDSGRSGYWRPVGIAVALVNDSRRAEEQGRIDRFWPDRQWQQWFELLYQPMMTIAQIRQVEPKSSTPVLESKVLYPCFEGS